MKARTIAIKTIARIIKVLTDSWSEPKTIGKGPMSKMPAPLVWPPVPRALITMSITATKAKTEPTTTRSNPAFAREAEAKLSPLSGNLKLREL